MERFSIESCVRGYHVYKDIWEASIGEELPCKRENGNRADPFAVAVVKNRVTVGHIPRKISSVCSLFLRRNGVISVCTTEKRRFSEDLPQGGLEIPCILSFEGASMEIQKVKKLVTTALSNNPTLKSCKENDETQPSKRRKTEKDSTERNNSEPEADTSVWVQCGGVVLTNDDRRILATGQKLTDQHINYAQTLLRLRFPKVNGLQSTLYQSHSKGFKANSTLQVIHSRGNHWVVATTIQCVPGEVKVFDSVYTSLDDGTNQTIQRMFGCYTSPLRVTVVNKPKQQGGNDCGIFAIAVCTCLAFGEDPSKMIVCQAGMRDHLLKCFEENMLTWF